MNKPVILCVDDEKDVLDTLYLELDEFTFEYDIELAETAEEALEIYADCINEDIDIPLVLADFLMPGMKGDELLVELHKKHPAMVKILLTGQATLTGVKNAYENASLYRYIPKPWEKQDITLTIKEALKSYYRDKSLQEAERKYTRIFENAVEGIFQTTLDGDILIVNPALARFFGFSTPEQLLSEVDNAKQMYINPGDRDVLINQIREKESQVEMVTRIRRKDGEEIWVEIFAGPVLNNKNKIVKIEGFVRDVTEKRKVQEELKKYQQYLELLVEERTSMLEEKTVKLDKALKDQNDNIDYAGRIQTSILPEYYQIKSYIKDFFIIWNPKDCVGGDFYWFKETKNGCLLGLADCTGHGVSGAFMTMIAYSELNRITDELVLEDPCAILTELCKSIKRTLNKEQKEEYADDGLDIALCYIPADSDYFIFAGAKMSLFIVEKGKTRRIKGDRQSIGYKRSKDDYSFSCHKISYSKSSRFYLSSDGYLEQLGGKHRRSFGYKKFSGLLEDIYSKPLDQHKDILIKKLVEYRGTDYDQVDDVTVIGFSL